MAIPASYIVSINPRVLAAGGTDLQTNGLLLTKNTLIPSTSLALIFSSAATVGEYFGTDSGEYAFAVKYFRGYNNKTMAPAALVVARRVDEPVGAFIRGGVYKRTLADIQAVTGGALSVSIDGTAVNITGVDFSTATSYSEAAAILQGELDAVLPAMTVLFSSLTGAFSILSPSGGEDSTITFASGDLASLLNLTEAGGAILSQGMNALTVTDNFAAIRELTDNWVTFTQLWEADNDEILGYAKWTSGQGVNYLYCAWSTDERLTLQGSTSSPADVIEDAELGAVCLQYGGIEYSAFVMGTAASINWARRNGVITFAFKSQEGLPANVTSEAVASILEGKGVNFYGNFATRNDDFSFLFPARMYGQYNFIDPYVNAVWLNNALQVAIMNGLTLAGRVPYNETGYAKIKAWMMDPVTRAKNNGVIDAGVVLSNTQISELIGEAGRDISGELFTNGYVVQVEDAGASVRTNRESPNVSLWYTYGGSVHRIVVASTAII